MKVCVASGRSHVITSAWNEGVARNWGDFLNHFGLEVNLGGGDSVVISCRSLLKINEVNKDLKAKRAVKYVLQRVPMLRV